MTSVSTDRIEGLTTSVAIKAPVRVATTASITLSGTQTIDGVAVVAEDRVLVKNQSTGTQNGIYTVSSTAWSRSSDCDGARDLALGTLVYIRAGTTNGGKIFKQGTTGTGDQTTIIFDTDSPSFSEADVFTPQTGAFDFTHDTSTAMADPGSGDFRLNSATLSAVTAIAFSATDADGSDLSDWIASFDDASGSIKGTIVLKDRATPSSFAIYNVTGSVTDNSTWLQVAVTHVQSSGSFTSGNRTTMSFARAGTLSVTISAFMETVLDDADAATARATLGAIILTDVTAASIKYTAGQQGTVTYLTDASTVTLNFSTAGGMTNAARLTLGGNRNIVASNLPTSGFRFPFVLELRQSTGGNVPSWSTDFTFSSSAVPVPSTAAAAIDFLPMYAESTGVRVGAITKSRTAT